MADKKKKRTGFQKRLKEYTSSKLFEETLGKINDRKKSI